MTWTVEITAPARRDLRRLDRQVAARVIEAIERLATTGQGNTIRLQGSSNEWRLRVGDWRVRFEQDRTTMTIRILRVLPRGRAYRG